MFVSRSALRLGVSSSMTGVSEALLIREPLSVTENPSPLSAVSVDKVLSWIIVSPDPLKSARMWSFSNEAAEAGTS